MGIRGSEMPLGQGRASQSDGDRKASLSFHLSSMVSSSLRTHLLLTTGSWLVETRSEASAWIHREYFATAARNALSCSRQESNPI